VGALDGLRVVELGGGIAAGYATKLLAYLGTDVL
jgi:crotonobetainyl-CoA:carnitine CoA-transferase CaiB-like acyl-CoA transferase